MTEFFEYLPTEKRRDLIMQRILRFAEEGYQYELNKKFALASGDEDSAEEAELAIQDLKVAIKIHEQELKSI
jgi:hypothetical protein